jgi:hypothetical protein
MMVCQVAEAPEIVPGVRVGWDAVPGMWGKGTVTAVRDSGHCVMNNRTLIATAEDPVLTIRLPDGKRVIRRSSSVQKKI